MKCRCERHGRSLALLALNASRTELLKNDHEFSLTMSAAHLPGICARECELPLRKHTQKIVQLFGDSAAFDWAAHVGTAGLVFVDGSHSYDNVRADSKTALTLVSRGGLNFWHDYGVWEGVTRALEDLENAEKLGLRHIRGTSLVILRLHRDWTQVGYRCDRGARASGANANPDL